MPRLIYLISHGEKDGGPNPGLTATGKSQTKKLRQYLPKHVKITVCGTGRRHRETAEALGLEVSRYSGTVGVPESKIKGEDAVLLADGTKVPYQFYSAVEDRAEAFITLVKSLPNSSVVVTSRSMVRVLGFNGEATEASIYRYDPDRDEIEKIFAASEEIGSGAKEV